MEIYGPNFTDKFSLLFDLKMNTVVIEIVNLNFLRSLLYLAGSANFILNIVSVVPVPLLIDMVVVDCFDSLECDCVYVRYVE